MKPALLLAALCVGALSACSADGGDPLAPSLETEALEPDPAARGPVAPTSVSTESLEDALDRIATTLDGPAAGRLRGALQNAIADARSGNATPRSESIRAALGAVDELEREAGAAVGAEADAIRLALGGQ
jgi:hypothetical protein